MAKNIYKKAITALSVLLAFVLSVGSACAQERIALIIGNSNYDQLGTLANTKNDAQEINASLEAMGYQTKLVLDASEVTLRKEIKNFASSSEKSNLSLVFYAGHGAQINGENYILPTVTCSPEIVPC